MKRLLKLSAITALCLSSSLAYAAESWTVHFCNRTVGQHLKVELTSDQAPNKTHTITPSNCQAFTVVEGSHPLSSTDAHATAKIYTVDKNGKNPSWLGTAQLTAGIHARTFKDAHIHNQKIRITAASSNMVEAVDKYTVDIGYS